MNNSATPPSYSRVYRVVSIAVFEFSSIVRRMMIDFSLDDEQLVPGAVGILGIRLVSRSP